MRELSIFVDESGDFGPLEPHAPLYVLGIVLHDQASPITDQLGFIHEALRARGLPEWHGIHTGPLIRREADYRWMAIEERRSLFRVLFDFIRHCDVKVHTWTFDKRQLTDSDQLIAAMSRNLGSFIREHYEYFQSWDRIVIYYDNGQKEITNVVNSVFNAHLATVEVRRVIPSDYSLFQAADLCCTLELLSAKMASTGLSRSERSFFSTAKASAERALQKTYLRPLDRMRFKL